MLVGEVTGLDQLAGDRGVWRVRGLPIGAWGRDKKTHKLGQQYTLQYNDCVDWETWCVCARVCLPVQRCQYSSGGFEAAWWHRPETFWAKLPAALWTLECWAGTVRLAPTGLPVTHRIHSLSVTKTSGTIYTIFPAFVCIRESTRVAFLSTCLRSICGINCFYNKLCRHLSDVRALGFSRPGDDAGDGQPRLTGVHKVWSFHL